MDAERFLSELPLEAREMYAEVHIGTEVESFLNTDVGRYLVERAKAEEVEALLELGTATDPARCEELRQTVAVSRSIRVWLLEAVQQANESEKLLRQADKEY